MNRKVKYISEIVFAFILIFISYFAWDRIDVKAYEQYITQYNSDNIIINVENEFSELAYLNQESDIEETVLYLNNYQNKVYNTEVILVLNGINMEFIKNLYLIINDNIYNLEDIYINNEDDDYYFLIGSINLKEYEKTNYNLKLLVDEDCDFSNYTSFSYKFIQKING